MNLFSKKIMGQFVYDCVVTFMGRNNVMGRYSIFVDTNAGWQEVL